ncbi:MAG: hypothetical protein WC286_04980 [Bacilli bacterium]|jgi:hypothetical protein
MNQRATTFRPVFLFAALVSLLVGCDGQLENDYEILKKEGEASGAEIPVGTYDSKDIVFGYKNTNSSISTTELYVALVYGDGGLQSRHGLLEVEEFCYFFPESGTGRFQSANVTFEYEASFNLEDGTASSLSEATASAGAIETSDTTFVQGFLNNAAGNLSDFLATYREYKSKTEEWLLDKLEDLGYEVINRDQEWVDDYESVINETYQINIEVKKLYTAGESNDSDYVQVTICDSETQASTLYYKRWGQSGYISGYYYGHTGNIFLYTKSYDTIQATFPSPSNQP